MTSEWKVHVTALAVMMAIGVAAPAAAFVASKWRVRPNEVRDTLVLAIPVDMESAIGVMAPAHEPVDIIKLPEVKIVAPSAAELVGHATLAHEPRCYWHQSETLSSGRVRICDGPRDKPEVRGKLTEHTRELPSPTGLIRRK